MERVTKKLTQLTQALTTLDTALHDFNAATSALQHAYIRDSVIKRFEYCSDLLWKTIKEYLLTIHGIEVNSPKSAYRAAHEVNFLSPEETEIFLDMVDDRNETSHTYNEEFAEELSQKITRHTALIHIVTDRLTHKLSRKE